MSTRQNNSFHSLEILEKNLTRVQEWIKAADQKISILFAFEGVMITLFSVPIFQWLGSHWFLFSFLSTLTCVASFFLLSWGFIKLIFSLAPQISRTYDKKSLIFFGDIAKVSLQEYSVAVDEMTEVQYREDLIEQIFTSSQIALIKHKSFKESLYFFVWGVFMLAVTYLSSFL